MAMFLKITLSQVFGFRTRSCLSGTGQHFSTRIPKRGGGGGGGTGQHGFLAFWLCIIPGMGKSLIFLNFALQTAC